MEKPLERTVHLISNAHLDPVWLWEWEEGAAAAISTFRTAADLCEQFNTFVFNHNEAILYRWVEELDPPLFARIQRLVQQGLWHIMGGWYLQPDCNMPSGESFVRQILLGRRYFAEKFGVRPTTAINFDPFGHSRGLVQILTRSGFDSYICCRPDEVNCPLPGGAFQWEGFDGSRVLAVRPWGHYLSFLGKAREKVEDYLRACPDDDPGILLWGVGDHGGGPSRADLLALREMIQSDKEHVFYHSTPEAYFADVRSRGQALPVVSKALNSWAVGCYSAQSEVKRKHRALENQLYLTEKLSSAAWAQDRMAYPRDELEEAMRDLATAEFHDILPGSAIQPVEEMALRLMDHGLEILSRVRARAFFALAKGQPAASEGEIPILVLNPHPYPVQAVVECEFQLADQNWGDDFTTMTAWQNGQPLPTQVEQELSSLALDWRKRVVFAAHLAPDQMNRFDCRLERIPARPVPVQEAGDTIHFQNDRLEIAISKRTGLLDRFRVDGVDYLRPGAGRLLVMQDTPDPWGMLVRRYRQLRGSFRLLSARRSAAFAGVVAKTLEPVRVVEDGAVRTVVEALFGYGDSAVCLRYKLPRQGAEVEIELRVHWNEKDSVLKLSLPLAIPAARLVGQVAYGVETLADNGDEVVAQKWAAATNGKSALTAVNDRVYGMDFTRGELRFTLLRSPGYSVHPILDRPLLAGDRYSPRHDQGERLFHFWLQGGPAASRLEHIDREALVHNEQPVPLSFFPNGDGEKPDAGVILGDDVVQLTACKKAEDGNALILRLFEPTGQTRSTVVDLPFLGISREITLKGFEIRTLRVDLVTKAWEEVNLIEERPGAPKE